MIASLRRYQDTLSTFDSVRLINRIDYSDTLAAADDALAKAQQFKNEAEARYNRAKQLDGTRQAMMKKMAGALSELEQPEIGGKLGNDGVAVIEGLKSYQGTLKGFDGVRLIDQVDYSDALAAADDALAKAQQFKNEIAQVDQVVNDLQELNKRIDRRGRRLLDGPTSSTVADIGKSVSRLSAAKIPLSSEARLQLSDTRVTLNRLPKIVDNVMDGEEKSILGREMPTRRGAWRFSLDKDKITDEERVQAFASIGSSQAKYDLAVTCGRFGAELVITTFESVGTEPKRLPWRFYGPTLDKDIRLRID